MTSRCLSAAYQRLPIPSIVSRFRSDYALAAYAHARTVRRRISMVVRKPFLSLALTLCFAPVFLTGVLPPADSETSPRVDNPGYLTVLNAKCDPGGAFFKCSDGKCSEISEVTFDGNGNATVTIVGITIEIHGQKNTKSWTSGKFNSDANRIIQCTPVKKQCPPLKCLSHGVGCGTWSVYTGKNCAVPAGGKSVQGWAVGCG